MSLRIFSPILVRNFLISRSSSKRNFFNLLKPATVNNDKATMDLIQQIEQNQRDIVSRLEKLEISMSQQKMAGDSQRAQASSKPSEEEIKAEMEKLVATSQGIQAEIARYIKELSSLEKSVNGKCADLSFLSSLKSQPAALAAAPAVASEKPICAKPAQPSSAESKPQAESKKEKAPKKEKPAKDAAAKKPAKQPAAPAEDAKPLDASRLDLRVGKIIDVQKHPDADSLYVEQIECGEEKPRTVVSGLVKFVPIEEMKDRMVVILCNLKPAKMRGVMSEAMVMCASTPEKVEVLAPPAGAVPGDRVTFEKHPGDPDTQLNPKKKIWEQIAPDLSTNGDLVATYKGDPFVVVGKGPVLAASLKNVAVK